MILGFKTTINGKPTYFVERIFRGIWKALHDDTFYKISFTISKEEMERPYKMNDPDQFVKKPPKLHTIREDKHDRWHAGVMIDFFINVRTKAMYRFAPSIPVVSTQRIELIWFNKTRSLEPSKYAPKRFNYLDLIVDDRLLEINEVEKLAQNDGFDTIEDFFDYFDKDFTGKIIHWTDLRYINVKVGF